MAYFDPNGREVTAADALSNGKLRNGYRQIMKPGEHVSFDMLLMDAKPKGSAASIDAASKLAEQKRQRDTLDTLRKGRYLNFGCFIEAADSENPVRPFIPGGMSPSDATAYLRKARYS